MAACMAALFIADGLLRFRLPLTLEIPDVLVVLPEEHLRSVMFGTSL